MVSWVPPELEAVFFLSAGFSIALVAAVLLHVLHYGVHMAFVGLHGLATLLLHLRKSTLSPTTPSGGLPPH